ncbi:hypothetical protein GCM10010112_81870 [Actinoplanes lobatus]|uniref:Uncharacterized protein n=1 Tax=Actinoplanes lobatus TaxID=113568 RepID=A0A7W7MJH7_9ACTN|nr:hypothetical protein [Actinoplanes lobatus]MBB4752599.1 hypothetical protein [Actinoplanes lobatus]GGN93532.1 hypothetical protein GCM10010112_81870 [Actinoplanes lobatus]GIE44733.1 hypothetical protein Alo02nite_76310 [Actinoplanes lobatus]
MTVLLDEPRVFVTYGSASVTSREDLYDIEYDPDDAWADESNGLCGAGVEGVLALTTGTHTGWLPFRVELYPSEPPLDDGWDDVVEVSYTAMSDRVVLAGLDGDAFEFDLPRDTYRVRYSVRGMDEADTTDETPDAYLLQFWPAPQAGGRIVKQHSERAAYWHRARRTLTSQEQQEDEQQEAEEQAQQARKRWGDRIPNDRLRHAEGLYLDAISRLDIDLEFAVADADDATQRQIATWATLRSLEQAGLVDLPPIAPAVAALRKGTRVPPPFDDSGTVWSILNAADLARTSVPVPPDGRKEQCPQNWAMSALFHSAMKDSLAAALETLVCLAYVHGRDGYRQAFTAVRQAFPQLARG